MASISRFDCASSSLTLKGLLRKTKRVLWICLGLGIAIHISLMQIGGFEADQEVVKPLTTQFIKRQPRLNKPLELKKRPKPRRRRIHREIVSIKARTVGGQRLARFEPTQVLRGLAQPSAEVVRITRLSSAAVEPKSIAHTIASTKDIEQKIDMALELLDIEALDTGQYHAMVIQDPEDKRNIEGFCRLAVVYSSIIYPDKYPRFEDYILPVVLNLADAMNRYTDVKTDIFGRISLDAPELFKTPWVYFMAFYNFKAPDTQLKSLGKYLTSGGFVFADTHPMPSHYAGGLHGLVGNIKGALETQGIREAAFQKLPNSHPLYHCYFDFNAPPPAGDTHHSSYHKPDYLEGIELDGRLVAIFTIKGYWCPWAYHGPTARVKAAPYSSWDPGRAFQFGVNLIIFALTQEGSITHRLMDSIK